MTTIASFGVAWAPFLASPGTALSVLHRLFPTQRGLFEDYVGNFWCVSSLVIKWKRLLAVPHLLRLCTGATLLAFLPSMVMEATRPSDKTFLRCLTCAAMSFFLFSFQVSRQRLGGPLLAFCWIASVFFSRATVDLLTCRSMRSPSCCPYCPSR